MSTPRALVIDDSATSRLLARNFLESDGWLVREASDAEQGTALAREWHPDVIVLDVVLPDADGVELCARWRAEGELQEIPVLLVSGQRLEHEDRAAGLRSGALGYLVKPFSAGEFLASVRLLYQLGHTHRQLKARNAELEASNRQLRQFAYVVSHDLKEPLRTMAGHCRRMAARCGELLDAAARQHLEVVLEGTERMQRLIDDLLAYPGRCSGNSPAGGAGRSGAPSSGRLRRDHLADRGPGGRRRIAHSARQPGAAGPGVSKPAFQCPEVSRPPTADNRDFQRPRHPQRRAAHVPGGRGRQWPGHRPGTLPAHLRAF